METASLKHAVSNCMAADGVCVCARVDAHLPWNDHKTQGCGSRGHLDPAADHVLQGLVARRAGRAGGGGRGIEIAGVVVHDDHLPEHTCLLKDTTVLL